MFDVRSEIESKKNQKMADFQKKLTPCDLEFAGLKSPDVKEIAKRIAKDDWREYINNWDGKYYEEYILRGVVVAYAKIDIDERLEEYKKFVPLINNWAVCDAFCSSWKPKKNELPKLWDFLQPYMTEPSEFGMRFGTVMMLCDFINDEYIDRVIEAMDSVKNDGYYLKMAVAWTLSVCFVKYPEKTMAYFKGNNSLDDFTYNKALQKIIESYRVDDETKKIIRTMKRK